MSVETAPTASTAPLEASATRRAIPEWRKWVSVAILLLLSAFGFVDRSIISLMVVPISASLGLSDFQIGLLQGFAFALFYALCGIPIGRLLDRHARNPIIYVGVTLWSLMSAACGLAHGFWSLLVARFGVGVGEAVLSPASYAIVSNMFPKERLSTALGVFSLGGSLGAAIAMLAGGLIIGVAGHSMTLPVIGLVEAWRVVFLVTGLPGVLLALLVFFVPEFHKRARADAPPRPKSSGAFAFMRSRAAFLTCHFLGYSLLALLAGGTVGWLPTYLIRHHGWTGAQAGAGMAIIVLSLSCGVMFGGVVVDALVRKGVKNAPMRYHAITTLVATLCGVSAFFFSSVWLTIALVCAALAMTAFGGVGASALQMVTPPNVRSEVSAAYLVAVSIIGTGGGPLVVASFTDFVFKDQALVGYSIALAYGCIAPIAFLCFLLGARFMNKAIDRAEADAALIALR